MESITMMEGPSVRSRITDVRAKESRHAECLTTRSDVIQWRAYDGMERDDHPNRMTSGRDDINPINNGTMRIDSRSIERQVRRPRYRNVKELPCLIMMMTRIVQRVGITERRNPGSRIRKTVIDGIMPSWITSYDNNRITDERGTNVFMRIDGP